jgi:hypothetical protein
VTARRVILLSLGATPPGEALVAGVQDLRADGAEVRLVSRVAPAPALAATLDGTVRVGRPAGGAVAVGKLTVDPHRLPGAASVVLSIRTRRLLRTADVLVAVDAAALPAAWLAARLNRRALAVNGLPAALARLGG